MEFKRYITDSREGRGYEHCCMVDVCFETGKTIVLDFQNDGDLELGFFSKAKELPKDAELLDTQKCFDVVDEFHEFLDINLGKAIDNKELINEIISDIKGTNSNKEEVLRVLKESIELLQNKLQ